MRTSEVIGRGEGRRVAAEESERRDESRGRGHTSPSLVSSVEKNNSNNARIHARKQE